MDVTVKADMPGERDTELAPSSREDRPAEPFRQSRRHFTVDAASAPLVTTALAWNAAASR